MHTITKFIIRDVQGLKAKVLNGIKVMEHIIQLSAFMSANRTFCSVINMKGLR